MKRRMRTLKTTVAIAALIYLVGPQGLIAQSSNRAENGNDNNGLTVETAFRPAFSCKPAVNKIQARKGQTINFEFIMEPIRESVRISVRPIALSQFETGGLKAESDLPPPPEVRLDGPGQYDLELGNELKLTGRIKLPNNDSDFHSFGILVQDNGYLSDDRSRLDESTFGIRFVSQYILRCDVTITNGRGTDIKNLQIESAELVEHNGFPSANVMVYNPTESTIEFEMQSKVIREGYVDNHKSVNLFSPINSNDIPSEKYTTRIFPQATLKMVAGWPDAIFPGAMNLETKITRKRKTYLVVNTPLNIAEDSFPAQSTFAAEIAQGVHVHPAQIHLSKQRGAKRMVPLNLSNFSTENTDLKIAAVDTDGQPVDWILVRPEIMTLKPGGKRKAMVSLKSISDKASHRIAYLQFSQLNSTSTEVTRLPVAFQGSDPFVPTLATNGLRIDRELKGGAFVVDVLNQSLLPLPIDATVEFKSSNGNATKVKAGYGQWLMPNARRQLVFDIDASVSEGELPVTLTFIDTKGNLIAEREFNLKIEKQMGEIEEVAENPIEATNRK